MYARLTTIVFAPQEPDAAGTIFGHILPLVEELNGFKGMVMLSGVEERSMVMLTLWETAAALAAAEPVLENLKQAETSFRRVEVKNTARLRVVGSRLNL